MNKHLLLFGIFCSLRTINGQNVRGIEIGFPEKWTGDELKEVNCPARGIPAFLDGYFLCQLSASYGRDYDPPGQRLTNMIDAIGGVASFHINQGQEVSLSGSYYPTRPFKIYEFYDRDLRKSKIAWNTLFSAWNQTQEELWDQIPTDPDLVPTHPNIDFWKIGRDIVGGTENPQWVGEKFDVPTLNNFKKFPFVETSDIFRGTAPIKLLQMPIHERQEEDGSIWASTSAFHPVEMKMYQIVFTVSASGVRGIQGMFEFGVFDPNRCAPNGEYLGDKRALPGYMHSITSTENYVILPVTSSLINPCKFLQPPKRTNSDIIQPEQSEFDRNTPLRFIVFNKRTKRFETERPLEAFPAMWVSHQFNAYEKRDGSLVADMIAYDTGDIYSRELNVDVRKREVYPAKSRLLRFTIDLGQNRVKYDYLIPQEQISAEFPQFNHNLEGKPYKYGYVVISPYAAGSQIMKIDVDETTGRNSKFFKPGQTIAVSEPWYVPNPGSTEEDDGVLLVRSIDTSSKKSSFYVIDARSMQEIGRADAPEAVPFGFHNRYFSKQDIGLPPGYKPPGTENRQPNPPIKPNFVPQPPPSQPRPINPGPFQPQPINPVQPPAPFPGDRNSVTESAYPNLPPMPVPPPPPTNRGESPNTVVVYPPSMISGGNSNGNNFGGSGTNSNNNNNFATRNNNNNPYGPPPGPDSRGSGIRPNPFFPNGPGGNPQENNSDRIDIQKVAEAGKKLFCSWFQKFDGVKGICGGK